MDKFKDMMGKVGGSSGGGQQQQQQAQAGGSGQEDYLDKGTSSISISTFWGTHSASLSSTSQDGSSDADAAR